MADQLKIESEGNFYSEVFYEYNSSRSNSRSDSQEFQLTATKKESFVREVSFAQAMFPEFFVKRVMKSSCTNSNEASLASINNESGPKKEHCKSVSDGIKIWYIKEYGLVISQKCLPAATVKNKTAS